MFLYNFLMGQGLDGRGVVEGGICDDSKESMERCRRKEEEKLMVVRLCGGS